MANIYGIDLGSRNLRIYGRHNGKTINVKNTVAIVNKNQLYSYGDEAYAMYEKAPENIEISFPVNTGVIADFNYLQTMIFQVIEKKARGHARGAEYIVATPTDITEVEKKAFSDLFTKSRMKPRSVMVCEKPIADAVGMGIEVHEPTGVMVVDIGAETTEISVVSLGGLVISHLMHFGSSRLDDSIVGYLKKKYGLSIGLKSAMQLKESIGSAQPGGEGSVATIGMDMASGLPVEREIAALDVYESFKENLNSICNSVHMILEKTSPELARDVARAGIYLTGGGAKIRGFDTLLSEITHLNVNLDDEPDQSAIRGLAKIASNEKYRDLAYSMKKQTFR